MSVRIALLSDDRLFCDGIARILQTEAAFDLAVYDAVAKLEFASRAGRVDVLLVDSRIDGAVAIAGAGTIAPASLLIAAPDDAAWCGEALCAGVSGVLPKQAGGDTLISAVRAVADGSVWAPRRVMAECIRHLVTASIARRDGTTTLDRHLSRREREIFRHAATGLGNKDIGQRLAIGEATVKAHLTSIFQKLGVRGRAELAALYHGVMPRVAASVSSADFLSSRPTVVLPKSETAAVGGSKK
ncbi:MAG TPA: response regulator transcription factor [Vicinamibacterales bacterium]|nr:response regulator transcription factor [Vicinamibacterales bacterium]